MFRDLRFGSRLLLKHPGFMIIAVLTLALGIGATAAVFSLIQGVLLTPPPYLHPARLALVQSERTDHAPALSPRMWPAAQWMDWQKESNAFDAIAAYGWSFNFLVDDQGSESIEGMVVTRDYFKVVGLQPVIGRSFVESETGAAPAQSIILGYELWQRKFNGDPLIVGKTVRMSRTQTPPTVIGVMPPGVRFLPSPSAAKEPNYNLNALVDFWMPATPSPERLKNPSWNVIGLMKEGVTPREAQAELAILVAREAQAEHAFDGFTPLVQSLTDELNADGRHILLPLFGAAALVLLIACGNTAALLLVRGLQRQQEYAVRIALGVGRIEAVRPGRGGESAARRTRQRLRRRPRLRHRQAVQAGGRPCDSTARCGDDRVAGARRRPRTRACFAAALAGLIPAVRATRLDPNEILKSGGPKSSAGIGERRAAARRDDRADRADARAAGQRRPADPHDEQPGERARRLCHQPYPDDDRDRGAGGLGRFSQPRAGAGRGRCRV